MILTACLFNVNIESYQSWYQWFQCHCVLFKDGVKAGGCHHSCIVIVVRFFIMWEHFINYFCELGPKIWVLNIIHSSNKGDQKVRNDVQKVDIYLVLVEAKKKQQKFGDILEDVFWQSTKLRRNCWAQRKSEIINYLLWIHKPLSLRINQIQKPLASKRIKVESIIDQMRIHHLSIHAELMFVHNLKLIINSLQCHFHHLGLRRLRKSKFASALAHLRPLKLSGFELLFLCLYSCYLLQKFMINCDCFDISNVQKVVCNKEHFCCKRITTSLQRIFVGVQPLW